MCHVHVHVVFVFLSTSLARPSSPSSNFNPVSVLAARVGGIVSWIPTPRRWEGGRWRDDLLELENAPIVPRE
jgi:hypothetical protein